MDHLEKPRRKVHPQDRNNVISNLFFVYAIKLFNKGFRKDLEETDLYDVLQGYRSRDLGDQLETEWEKQKQKGRRSSVVRLMLACYGFHYLRLGFIQVFMDVTMITIQPYTLSKLIKYFSPGQTELTKEDAYFYAGAVIGLNFFYCIYKHNYYLLQSRFIVKVKAAFCSFVYRKVLKMSPAHLGDVSIGKIVTLITKDVDTFEAFVYFGNDLWIAFIKTFLVTAIVYNKIGVASLAGAGCFFITMPLQMYLGSKVTKMKLEICKTTDRRFQLTQEALSAIRIIKIYTWERFFDKKISTARRREIHKTFKLHSLRFLILSIGTLTSHIAFYMILMCYMFDGNNITAEVVYFVMSIFSSLSYGLSILFPLGAYHTAELRSAIKRIGQIIKATELETEESRNEKILSPKIFIKNISVAINSTTVLKRVNLNAEKGLTLIAGPVGSGKTFLLKTILQDFKPDDGTLAVEGGISYASQEPWLFPSSVKQNILFGEKYDEKRYKHVLKVCALEYDFELLEAGDGTIVEDRGVNLSKGQQARINLARAVYKDSDIYLLDDPLAALDTHIGSFIFKECILKFLKDKLVVLVSHNVDYVKDANVTVVLQNGRIKQDGKLALLNQYRNSSKNHENKGIYEENEEESATEETKLITEITTERKVYHEEKQSGEVGWNVYKRYIKFGGGFLALFLVYCLYILAQVCVSYTDKLVSNWVNLEEKMINDSVVNSAENGSLHDQRSFIFYTYVFMTAATAVTTLLPPVALLFFARNASIKLHKKMISSVISAPMRFFDTNFIGNILNRFSKDLLTIDDLIPLAAHHVFRVLLILIGITTLIASVNTMFLMPSAIFFLILLALRRYCLRTSRNLKRLEALTRAPVVGHLNASVEGLTTIRAFKAQSILRNEFDRHQDLYTSASYILTSSMRGFAFTMDMLCGFFVGFIVLRFLVVDDGFLAGHVGLAISQAFSLTGILQWGIRQWAEIENRMTSVERVLEYTQIKQEGKQGLKLENWPEKGKISYENVYLAYTNSKEYILKNMNFTVQPQEKIGIVGRTGAGKSSIISTLFRLYEVEGKITIDDVDTKTLCLDSLREKISIIPQDPVLFTGTVRDNIDPTRKYTDEEIWKAIEVSNLKPLIPSLDFEITESGSSFSIGQRQLICLARAVNRKNKILILDEATANMDPETDEMIHRTIRENFKSCTVFTIAHKLSSVLDNDKVMVLDKGEIVEFDTPENLLRDVHGIFHQMVAKAGLLTKSK